MTDIIARDHLKLPCRGFVGEAKLCGDILSNGFGTFEVSERAAREGRNPQTGESMTIKASRNARFKAGKALKDSLN